MSGATGTEPGSPTRARRFDRGLVRLFPPSWRARYGEEFAMLLADGPTGPRRSINVVGAAAMAWLAPRHHLLPGTTRVRTSISVVAYAWTAMTAGALLFGQITEGESLRVIDNAHAGSHRLYAVYVNAAHLSVAAVLLGSVPLVWSLLSAARRDHRRDIPKLLLTPGCRC